MEIIGREDEMEILQEIYSSCEPHFLAVYGRRRIGKTFIISEIFKDKGIYFEVTGMKNGKLLDQLFQFSFEFSRIFNKGVKLPTPKSWIAAFQKLQEAIEQIRDQKIILFFDEAPWLASRKSGFLSALEHFWNRYLSKNPQIILIICGSSASWIIKKVIYNKGGLYNRVTRKMRLLPFKLQDVESYLKSRQIGLDRKQIVDLYMVFGGVPKYLSYVKRGHSVAQIISETCFSDKGALYEEFSALYGSLFEDSEQHIAVVHALSEVISGMTKSELLTKAHLSSGGTSSKVIQELVDAGFIMYIPPFGKKKVDGKYRLYDEYSLFYLTWIKKLARTNLESGDGEFWMKKQGTPEWHAWSGYAFESLCLKHIGQIKKALGISGVETIASGWWYHSKDKEERGAQIDLVIDREDRCVNLCEMKYSDSQFAITKDYLDNLKNKKQVFREKTQRNKALFTTMVTPYGVKKNSYSLEGVDRELTLDDLFS